MKWTAKRIDEIGTISRGRSRHRPRDAAHLYGGPYPFVQTGDVKHAGLYLTEFSQTYSEAGLEQSRLWPEGTLCITIAANIADTSILTFPACFPDSVIGFIPDPHLADVRFVKYLFDSSVQRRLRQFTQGAAQDNLSQEKLLSLELQIPDLPTQRRIAEILSAYDDLIENNQRRMKLLEESARLLYEEWFVRLRFPGHEHTKIVDGVPEGWARSALSELSESIDYGYTASAEKEPVGPRFLRITDIVPDVLDWSSVPYCQIESGKRDRFLLSEGDIVIARTGATVGYAKRIHRRHEESVFASYLVRLKIRQEYDNLMIGIFAESSEYKKFVMSRINGAAQPNANAKVLSSAIILMPTAAIQSRFREKVEPMVDQRELLQAQNQKLRAARDLLLPRLMNGEIEV